MQISRARSLALAAAIALIPSLVRADAISDQKKIYDKLGIKIPHPPALCSLITKAEAERYLKRPVGSGESAGAASGCAYRALSDPQVGILVTRDARSDWGEKYAERESEFRHVDGIGESAYTYHSAIGYNAGALTSKGSTEVLVSGTYGVDTALALLRIAMNR